MTDIEEILKATIQTKVIEAFNSTPEMIEKLVQAALSKPVNEAGQIPTGHRYNEKTMPFMDWLVGEEIRRAITEIVRERIQEHDNDFKEKIKKAMESGDVTAPISDVIGRILSEEYRWSVNLDIKKE